MTCIVGVEYNGGVWMAGDSASGSTGSITLSNESKVFHRGQFLIGFTTSWRFGQLLKYKLVVPEYKNQNVDEYMACEFADAVRKVMGDNGFLVKDKEQEEAGNCLVAFQGRLYEMQDNFDVMQSAYKYNSVGSGEYVARGALTALEYMDKLNNNSAQAKEACLYALEAAERHNPFVRGPHTIEVQLCP